MILDFKELSSTERYKIISQTVTPRPIAWIVTEQHETVNIAPFSYFIPLSSNPPSVLVSVGHKRDGTPKDTLDNIRHSQKATICLVQEHNLEKMHLSSEPLPKEQSEAIEFNIKTKKILDSYPPMIENTHGALFCSFLQQVNLENSKTIPLIMEIHHYYLHESIVDENMNISLENIGRVGKSYLKRGEIFTFEG